MSKNGNWFRFYENAVDDPKIQRLSPVLFKGWVNLLCLAARHGGVLPGADDIAFSLRVSRKQASKLIADLQWAGLIDTRSDGGLEPHNWNARQFKTDVTDTTNAERQRRHRERQRNAAVTASVTNGVTGDVTQTQALDKRPDTDTDTDTDTPPLGPPSTPCAPASRRTATLGHRLPGDWQPSEADADFARQKGFDADAIAEIAASFADYWRSLAGAKARKVDWGMTWKNWVRKELERSGPRRAKPQGPKVSDTMARLLEGV